MKLNKANGVITERMASAGRPEEVVGLGSENGCGCFADLATGVAGFHFFPVATHFSRLIHAFNGDNDDAA